MAAQSYGQDSPRTEAEAWLERVASAARQLNYQGVFTYRYGQLSESSRITHVWDETGEQQKIELLEGPAREIIRYKDEVWCYMPEMKIVKIDRADTRRFFPALIQEHGQVFSQSYRVKLGPVDRVAGRECQMLVLEPKDQLRYGYRLCADRESGLLLRASMVRGLNEILEQFVFSEIRIGEFIPPEKLKPTYVDSNWPVEKPRALADHRWALVSLPTGFKKIMELERKLASRPNMVTHFLLSDGLAAVSVFIEPRQAQAPVVSRAIRQGPVSFYSRQVASHLVTALGEVPPATVQQIANSVVFRGGQ